MRAGENDDFISLVLPLFVQYKNGGEYRRVHWKGKHNTSERDVNVLDTWE
jgi:hypothetical protein